MTGGKSHPMAIDLVAVILVARLRLGPKLIYHYPSDLEKAPRSKTAWQTDSDSEVDEFDQDMSYKSATRHRNGNPAGLHGPLSNPPLTDNDEESSDTIFGYTPNTLQKLLSPGCWADRKKFELCLDGLTFVGHPVWAAQDGTWSKRHIHEEEASKQQSTPLAKGKSKPPTEEANPEIARPVVDVRLPPKPVTDFTHVPESFDSQTVGESFPTSLASGSSLSAATVSEQLMMFNVVFVLNSSQADNHHEQVSDVHQHVAKVLSKALQYCQKQSQYLGLESKKLLDIKAKARQDGVSDVILGKMMIESSGLAWALKEVFEKISEGEVAGIRLNGLEMSLHIPPHGPSNTPDDDQLEPHTGLLLLEEKGVLLAELTHPDASALAYFIQEHTPTKSLQKLALRMDASLQEVFNFARHLIKWRKARTITPLHPRNTYIVGPDAPLDRLQSHYIPDYAKRFPILPSLPQILTILSSKPIRYGLVIPSRDHRTPYMEILAYLVQHCILEQLKTFGWLQAPTSVVTKSPQIEDEPNENKRPLSVASLLSPQLRPMRDDDATSVSSERTAIPVTVMENSKKRPDITSYPRGPEVPKNEDDDAAQIVKDPYNPSAEDRLRLQHIRDSSRDVEFRECFHALLRYFDGTWAFEEIAAMEGVKRAKVEGWLDWLAKEGFLITFRAT